jgi:predicted aconitase
MELTCQEDAWLNGDAGPATQRAMEIVVALARIYGADRLLPVNSVQISGVSYRNIGAAGVAFLRQWADEGARVRV